MQPGLARAVPSGILGFVGGALIAVLIRLAQGLDPNPAQPNAFVGPAMVLGTFISAFAFVWGMGGFNPKMSVHGEHAEEAHEEPEAESPTGVLGNYIWRVTFWTVIGLIVLFAIATLPTGPTLRAVKPNEGNPAAVGMTTLGGIYEFVRGFSKDALKLTLDPLPANLAGLQISYLAVFIFFVIFTILTLFVITGLLGMMFTYFAQGKKNPTATQLPYRALVYFLLIMGPMITFLTLFPRNNLALALIAPIFVLPPLILLIAYRQPILAVWLLITLALPPLVPEVIVPQLQTVVFGGLLGAIALLLGAVINQGLPVGIRQGWMWLVTLVAVLLIVVVPLAVALPEALRQPFVQAVLSALFILTTVIASALLLLPIWFLRRIIAPSVWEKFASIRWGMVIPEFAGWLARVLRGLPSFIGQR